MNRIAAPLYVIGWLTIACGMYLGYFNMETMVPETDMFGDTTMVEGKSWTIFFMYLFAGLISGIVMFGFAEIIKLLDDGNAIKKRIEAEIKHTNKMEGKNETDVDKAVGEHKKEQLNNITKEIEKELLDIENNNQFSADMKAAMKASVKRREGIE